MSQQDIEVILMKQLAGHLVTPVFLVDMRGSLLYYNEPAEIILGRRFDETGVMVASEWGKAFVPSDEAGNPLSVDDLPIIQAMTNVRPAHSSFFIRGIDGVRRKIEVTALPLLGLENRRLGAVAFFWEVPRA